MIRDHVVECREDINRAQVQLNNWWERYKELSREHYEGKFQRQQAYEERERERRRRREEKRQRIEANLAKNGEALRRANVAFSHQESRLSDLNDKLDEATSEKWITIFSEWISEAHERINNIRNWIATLEGWLDEDETKLRHLG